MAHLVNPIIGSLAAPIPTNLALEQLQEAHQYIAVHSAKALLDAVNPESLSDWGTRVKRVQVNFLTGERPALIDPSLYHHNLIETINQCATMERLIDALAWARDNLPEYQVLRCHPTTSSQKIDPTTSVPDHDLILVNDQGQWACFEVSDVNSSNDGNRKEQKELMSLGVLAIDGTPASFPANRLFLVVSAEFGDRLRRQSSSKRPKHYRYKAYLATRQTTVLEILAANAVQ